MPNGVEANIGLPLNQRMARYRFDEGIRHELTTLVPDNWHGLLYIVKEYCVIAIFVALPYWSSWWLYPLSVLMIGAHQRGLSTILHDSAHGVLARNRLLNFVLGTSLTAWPIFQRYFAYRTSHVRTHHPYLGRSDVDPDLAFFIEEGVFKPTHPQVYLLKIVFLPMIGSKTWAYLKYLVRNRYSYFVQKLFVGGGNDQRDSAPSKPVGWRQKFDSHGFSIFWLVAIALFLATGHFVEFVLFWIVPYVTAFHILGWFIELSEHCSSTQQQDVDVRMARNRRSRHIEKWLTGINNDHHHLDHHLDPRTPFWLLPKAHLVRMRDPVYAAHCKRSGGLFQRGTDGAPSILSLILEQNRARYDAMINQPPSERSGAVLEGRTA